MKHDVKKCQCFKASIEVNQFIQVLIILSTFNDLNT
jgi:hypothetical protein